VVEKNRRVLFRPLAGALEASERDDILEKRLNAKGHALFRHIATPLGFGFGARLRLGPRHR
jgi:hypothetical protein